MCVIILAEDKFPTLDTLKSAEALNGHGGSIAWVEKQSTVRYYKNISADEMHTIIETQAQLPAIIHFRIASIGGVDPLLCHPFPITSNSELALDGEEQAVLFHNGTWSDYKDVLLQAVLSGKVAVPDGALSDSRVMALLANAYGHNVLSLIPQNNKIAILTPDGIKKYGLGWVDVDKNTCSNAYFVPSKEDKTKSKKLSKKDKRKLARASQGLPPMSGSNTNWWTFGNEVDEDDIDDTATEETIRDWESDELTADEYNYLWSTRHADFYPKGKGVY